MFLSEIVIKPGDGSNVIHFIDIVIEDQYRLNDIKIIRTSKGKYHLVLPSRKIEKRCIHCSIKNKISAKYCNDCGGLLQPEQQLYADLFFPICIEARQKLEEVFLSKFKEMAETIFDEELLEIA